MPAIRRDLGVNTEENVPGLAAVSYPFVPVLERRRVGRMRVDRRARRRFFCESVTDTSAVLTPLAGISPNLMPRARRYASMVAPWPRISLETNRKTGLYTSPSSVMRSREPATASSIS
jgi:hypothetical protein